LVRVGEAPEPQGEIPERLGDFRLLERLGAGGMGVVFRARQESLQRDVALKLIKPEHLYFIEARERFRREVEAAARLRHPGIVPVYTVGDQTGLPHFAMELVEGASLAAVIEHLRDRRAAELSAADLRAAIAARARRFGEHSTSSMLADAFTGTWVQACCRIVLQVADALHHAHELGVLHRDVKPSNVIVTAGGRAMLLDFGLATTTEASRITRTGAAMGSLPYMPPECLVSGTAEADRRADVYSLGVTLFELLSLRLPFGRPTIQQTMDAIASGEHEPLAALNPTVPWDAATVCATAMERELPRRYATAADFARDLRNLLELRPIEARRASRRLRARRWVQRHPTATVAAALGFLLVVVAPSVGLWRIRQERDVAAKERDIARREVRTKEGILEFLLRIIGGADTTAGNPGNRTVNEVVDDAVEQMRTSFHGAVAARALVLRHLAAIQQQLGRPRQAADLARESIACLVPDWGEQNVQVAMAQNVLASNLLTLGELEEAERLFAAAAETLRGSTGEAADKRTDSRMGIANIWMLQGRLDDADALLQQIRGELSWDAASVIIRQSWLQTMAQVSRAHGEFERERDLQVEVLDLVRKEYGEVHRQTAGALQNLGVNEMELGHLEEALALLTQARDIEAQLGAGDSIDQARLEFNLGGVTSRLARLDESAEHFGRALAISRALAGDSAQTARSASGMGAALYKLGRYDEAEAILREALDLNHRYLPERGMSSMEAPLWLARTLAKQGRHEESAVHFADLLWRLDGDPGIGPTLLATYEGEFADELDALGRSGEAEQHRQKQRELLAAAVGAPP